jgi:hypothetical protein
LDAGTFKDLTAVPGQLLRTAFLNLNNNTVFTGTVSITGNSSTNRLLVQSNSLGTPRVITAAATSLTDVDFMDISIVGPVGSTITSDSFNRANGALVGSMTDAAAGGTALEWLPTAANNANWQVVGNKASFSTNEATPLHVDTGTANHYVSLSIEETSNAAALVGLIVRYTSWSSFHYAQYVPGSTTVNIKSMHVTAVDTIAIVTLPTSLAVGEVLGLGIIDNIIVLYRNGLVIHASSIKPAYAAQVGTTSTKAGVYAMKGATNALLDNFQANLISNVTGTRLGDCLGNSGIEFTTASGTARDGGGAGVKRYAVAAGNWSSTATWSESDGGAPGASVPLPQDDVYIKRSFSSETITIDMPRLCRLLDFTGSTGTLHTSQLVTTATIFGSLVLANIPGNLLASNIRLLGKSNTITTNSRTFINANSSLVIDGSYTMTDQLFVGGDLSSIYGSLNTGSYAISCGRFMFSYSGTLNLGSSSITITQTGAATPAWTVSSLVNLSAASSTITFALDAPIGGATSSAAATHTFAGGDKSYGTLTYTVADSPGALTISGSNTFGTVNIGSGRSLKLTSGTTQKIGTLNLNGVPRGGVRLPGVVGSYLSTPDSAAVSVTGDIDIRCRVALPDYTIASDSGLVTKYGAAGQRSFRFYFDSVGRLNFNMSTDGTANTGLQWQAGPTFVDGTTYWVRTTRTAAGTLRFFYAADQPTMPTSWTEAGLSQTLSAGQNIFDSTSPVEVGSMTLGTAYLANGVFYRAQIRNNVLDDGSGIVFDTDFSPARFWSVLSSIHRPTVRSGHAVDHAGERRGRSGSSSSPPPPAQPATLQVGSVTGNLNYVDLKGHVVMHRADTYIGATSVIRSNVKGVRRGPKTGMSMMMGV